MNLKPSQIRYSQDDIRSVMRPSYTKVTTTLEQILQETTTVSDIEKIDVMKHTADDELNGTYFVTNGHRRLFIFKVRN